MNVSNENKSNGPKTYKYTIYLKLKTLINKWYNPMAILA